MSKIREKESLECGRMHIWALKTQKLPGPLSGPWTPATNCSLRSCDSASLCRQLSASGPGPPSWPNPGSAPVLLSAGSGLHYFLVDETERATYLDRPCKINVRDFLKTYRKMSLYMYSPLPSMLKCYIRSLITLRYIVQIQRNKCDN